MNLYILDELRNPVPVGGTFLQKLLRFGTWMEENEDLKRVGLWQDEHYTVSTVFLGIDHAFSRQTIDDEPALFETMVFHRENANADLWGEPGPMERYATWAEAEAGHAAAVLVIKKKAKAK